MPSFSVFWMLRVLSAVSITTVTVCHAWSAEWIDLSSVQSTTNFAKVTPPRSGHVAFTANNDNDSKQLYVFGGYAEESIENRYCVNDLWKWTNNGWNLVAATNTQTAPQERLASAAATLQGNPLIIGGWDSQQAGTGGVILQDVVAFDSSAPPQAFKTLDLPAFEPMSRHVAVAISESTVLVHNHRCTDHVLLIQQETKSSTPILRKQPTAGLAPSPRGMHGACLLGVGAKTSLYVLCGAAQDGNMSNEVYKLNLETWEWSPVDIIGTEHPSPRAAPSVCAVDDSCLVLFGGAEKTPEGGLKGCDDLWILEVLQDNEAVWRKCETSVTPPGRNAATLSSIASPLPVLGGEEENNNTNTKYFLLAGGWAPFRVTYNDNFVLKVSKTE